MKKYIIIILSFGLLLSCNNDDDIDTTINLIGKWRLVEQLLDPGDGSGTFQPIVSDLTLEFFNNGTVVSTNGSLCDFFIQSEGTSSGTFALVDNRITIECPNGTIFISFEKEELDLILRYGCIEACAQKYKRVS